MSLKIISNGSPVAVGGVKLSVASSTVDLTNCRFWNDRGSRKYGQESEASVTLVVTTTPTSIADLYLEATGENWHDRFDLDVLGMTADAPSAAVSVYMAGATDSVDYVAPTTRIFVVGQVPQEVWSYGAGIGAGSNGDPVLAELAKAEDSAHTSGDKGLMTLAVRKDSPGTLAGADSDYAPFQLNSEGALRVEARGAGVPGLGAEQYGGFPVGGRAASSDRGALGATEFATFTMSLLAKLINLPYALPGATWSSLTSWSGSSSSTAAKAAGGSGVRHYVTSITYTDEGGATPTGTHMKVKDGSTVVAKIPLNHTVTFPVPLRFTANTAINLEPSGSITGSVTLAGFSAGE